MVQQCAIIVLGEYVFRIYLLRGSYRALIRHCFFVFSVVVVYISKFTTFKYHYSNMLQSSIILSMLLNLCIVKDIYKRYTSTTICLLRSNNLQINKHSDFFRIRLLFCSRSIVGSSLTMLPFLLWLHFHKGWETPYFRGLFFWSRNHNIIQSC